MTLFHLANCLALTFAPFFISYKYSGLAEYSSVWRLGQASLGYFGTQLLKLLILATFFPATEQEGLRFDPIVETMKSTVDVLDLVGLHLTMVYGLVGKAEAKFLVAGIGWSLADAVATRLLPFWVGARGFGFDWKYVQMALESNLNLVHLCAVAALVWCRFRADIHWQMKQLATGFLLYAAYRVLIFEFLAHVVGVRNWSLLLVKAISTLVLTICSAVVYSSLPRVMNNN